MGNPEDVSAIYSLERDIADIGRPRRARGGLNSFGQVRVVGQKCDLLVGISSHHAPEKRGCLLALWKTAFCAVRFFVQPVARQCRSRRTCRNLWFRSHIVIQVMCPLR